MQEQRAPETAPRQNRRHACEPAHRKDRSGPALPEPRADGAVGPPERCHEPQWMHPIKRNRGQRGHAKPFNPPNGFLIDRFGGHKQRHRETTAASP